MNCKPGDLAIVTKGAQSSGRIVRCVRLLSPGELVPTRDGQPTAVIGATKCAWLIEGWVLLKIVGSSEGMWCAAASDLYLKPLRDPGDDAVDESKAWLPPVPLPTIEPHLLEVGK